MFGRDAKASRPQLDLVPQRLREDDVLVVTRLVTRTGVTIHSDMALGTPRMTSRPHEGAVRPDRLRRLTHAGGFVADVRVSWRRDDTNPALHVVLKVVLGFDEAPID